MTFEFYIHLLVTDKCAIAWRAISKIIKPTKTSIVIDTIDGKSWEFEALPKTLPCITQEKREEAIKTADEVFKKLVTEWLKAENMRGFDENKSRIN